MSRPEYRLYCPNCGSYIYQPETNLEEIVRYRGASTTGAPFLTLVCPRCKSAYQFDWQNRQTSEGAVLNDAPPQKTGIVRFSVVARCDGSNCKSQVELVALRESGTAKEQCLAEMSFWKLDGIVCEYGHQITIPNPEALREWVES